MLSIFGSPGPSRRTGHSDLRGTEQPVENRLDLKRLHARAKGQNAGSDASQVRRRPARGRLIGERTEIAPAVRQELHLVAQIVGELERVFEKALVHGHERRGEGGGVASRYRVFVVSSRKNKSVLVVGLLDRALEL